MGEFCLESLQFKGGIHNEEADHFVDRRGAIPLLLCSVFGQGSIIEGVCGIAIAAALGVFGYVTMKRTQAAELAKKIRKMKKHPLP